VYGKTEGICRITGKVSIGTPFNDWVRDTFTDHASLKPGTIISNEALFCFDESSEEIMRKTGRDKKQRFRTYSHVVNNGEWLCLTKSDKERIGSLLPTAQIVCLTDSGQKHLLFKHKLGMWQLDDIHIEPDVELFTHIHGTMMQLIDLGFSQEEIKTGRYIQNRIVKSGLSVWRELEGIIFKHRGSRMFTFASWLMHSPSQK